MFGSITQAEKDLPLDTLKSSLLDAMRDDSPCMEDDRVA